MQPLVWDGRVLRFQTNAIVAFLVDLMGSGAPLLDYNALMAMSWSDADRDQFNQLHGYSVSGLPYRSRRTQLAANALAGNAVAKRYPKRVRR